MTEERVRRGIGCGFGGAMVAAPFLAWVWGAEAAVGVMVIALAATSYLAIDASLSFYRRWTSSRWISWWLAGLSIPDIP